MKPPEPQISEKLLLKNITSALSYYISETDPYILFNGLLDILLEITDSEYGLIGEVFYSQDNLPYVKSYATTDISWSEETQALYNENKKKGMLFSRLDSLYGAVLKTGQLVIANQAITDPRSCGLPHGHPPLDTFMGIPFYGGGKLLGMVGVANRKTGYQLALAESLQPFLITCGNLIQAYRNNVKNQQVEVELLKYKQRLEVLNASVSLGFGYEFNSAALLLVKDSSPVSLTKKESKLLDILVKYQNLPCQNLVIEKHLWGKVIVGESSLRALVLRLRKKLPELTIKTLSGVGYMLIITA
ncbi:MAG: GAF domain-containing protein [Pseudomonadota bacterium]